MINKGKYVTNMFLFTHQRIPTQHVKILTANVFAFGRDAALRRLMKQWSNVSPTEEPCFTLIPKINQILDQFPLGTVNSFPLSYSITS